MGGTMNPKVLVVDDEKHIVELARLYLTREGYEVEGVGDGAQAVARFTQVKPDLVILDIMLPGTDGLTICKEIRKLSQVPIIMLTARDEVTDKVVGLEVGADDYLTKPFHPQELVARAKALLRRAHTEPDQPKVIRAGKLEVDLERHQVRQGDARVQLTPKEFDLLAARDQLDRSARADATLVRPQECAIRPASPSQAGAPTCRLDAPIDFSQRLSALAPTLDPGRLNLLNKQRVVMFDSAGTDTVGQAIPVAASKRVIGVGEARTLLGGQIYLVAAVGITPARDPLGASYVLVARPQSTVTGAAAGELVPRLLEAGGAALLVAMLLALLVSLSVTRPLRKLAAAAEDIAAGRHSPGRGLPRL